MDLSIIIPALNESKKIERDLLAAASFLEDQRMEGEILVVDDGSTDDTTTVVQRIQKQRQLPVRAMRYELHRGKGFAVRSGIAGSRGNFVLFIDSGMTIPLHFITSGLELLKQDFCEIAHASRKLPESEIRQPHKLSRKITSWAFQKTIKYWLNLPRNLTDTQCGFKIYPGEIGRELYSECQTDGFLFDLEIIIRAQKKGYRIQEFPIQWTADPDSRLSLRKAPQEILKEIYQIRKITFDSCKQ